MDTTAQDLASFSTFVHARLERGETDLSIDELFDLWRAENPSPESHDEDVAAVAAAIEDFRNGDRGLPAGQLSQSLRNEFGIAGE